MSRRLWLFAAVLATALAVAAPASAHPRHEQFLGGARHLGKPAQRHLIAVRHGHHIQWFSRTHGLAKKHLPPIKLNADVWLGAGVLRSMAVFGPTSAPTVTGIGTCNYGAQVSPDGMAYVQSYDSLYGDVLNCVGNNGGHTEGNSFYPNPACTNDDPQSVHNAPLEYATFTDGEWLVLCTVPDDNGAGGSQANSEGAPYTVYQQGFRCDAAIGVGGSDGTPYLAKTSDSLEYSQTYTETSDGISQSVTALTTTCIGQLPNSVTIDTSAVPHLVSCTQYDPNAPGQVVRGLGETITYPDRQFQETCNVPAYRQDVVCVTSVSCSTDASADATSDLEITEDPASPGTLTEQVDPGNPLSCAARQYGGYTGFDPNWYTWSFTGTGSKQLTYDLYQQPDLSSVEVCFGANIPFRTISDDGTSQLGTLPDGTQGYIGLLADCPEDVDEVTEPCVESRSYFTDDISGTEVDVFIPQAFDGDPAMHG